MNLKNVKLFFYFLHKYLTNEFIFDFKNMEPNHYYCRSAMQQNSSTSIPQHSSNKLNYGLNMNAGQDYVTCSSGQPQSGYNSKDLVPRNGNNKSLGGNGNMGSPYGGSVCSNSGQCTKNTANPGNYINIMTVPLGTLQYNRKKLSTQDYE